VFVEEKLLSLMNQFSVPRSNVVVDQDGIGGGVYDHLPGIVGFVNNGRPIEQLIVKKLESPSFEGGKIHNFRNLKAQCYFKLAELVSEGKISVYTDIPLDVKNFLIEDLEQIKRKDADKDGKLEIVPKDEIKEKIGRSTDFGDALMMRMYWELKSRSIGYAF
jgi:hypothetical protein